MASSKASQGDATALNTLRLVEIPTRWHAKHQVLVLEYKREDQETEVQLREQLANWFNTVMNEDMTANTLFDHLQSGVVLCNLAKMVSSHPDSVFFDVQKSAPAFSIRARENIAKFVEELKEIDRDNIRVFDPDDLIERNNDSAVLECLVDVVNYAIINKDMNESLVNSSENLRRKRRGTNLAVAHLELPKQAEAVQEIDLDALDDDNKSIGKCVGGSPRISPVIQMSENTAPHLRSDDAGEC